MELKEIQAIFKGDRFADELGAEILEGRQGFARCGLLLRDNHRNAAGGGMGGVLFTLADFAFAVAANWEKMNTVSLTSQITFLSRVRGARLEAAASCVKTGKSTCCYTVEVTDDLGTKVALVSTTGFISG